LWQFTVEQRRHAMMLSRRRLLVLAASAATVAAPARFASARGYPTRPVRVLVGFAPGGAPDILARLIGQWLSSWLGQTFVVENKPGANGNLAIEAAARAEPDGYTLLLVATIVAIDATLYENSDYSFEKDLTAVGAVSHEPVVMIVNPEFPARTTGEFIAYAKANPGKLNMASPGIGTGPHMAGELFKAMAGIDMTHVAYRSSAPILTDLLGGQVQVYFAPISVSIEYVRSGKVRALGVTTATRAVALPDVPPLGDGVPGYEMTTWYGIAAPKNTPAEIVDTLNKEINGGLADPGVTAHLTALGSSPFALSPAAFGTFIADETGKWAKVIRTANIKAD
jgi:tripartite-type tricarboxylate transporter receptor subunit TctC